MAFRVLDRARTFFGLTGQLLAGGRIDFYTSGTTTPKDVYGEQALTTNNGDSIALDASGRLSLDVWGAGDYRYRVYDSDGAEQADVDDVIDPSAAGLTLPSGDAGQFLTTDGAGNYSFVDVREVPDPTGNANKYLKTDGTALSWSLGPEDANITVTSSKLELSDGVDTWMELKGTDSAAASGTYSASDSVVFSDAFGETPHVDIALTSSSHASGPVVWELTAVSSTGFTVRFDVAEGDAANASMVNAVPYSWKASGLKA